MNKHSVRQQVRNLLNGSACVYPASVFDPVSARMAKSLGYECGMFAGSVGSMVILGDPDHVLMTLSEFVHQAYRICRGSDLPLLVDADHGYGNALNVMRTVSELEAAGVCGLSIEDTDLPRPFGTQGKNGLISLAEGIGKMKAAVAARTDEDLILLGRTSAAGVEGVDAAAERIRAYQDTGVDALFLIGVKERSVLESLASVARLPLMLGSAGQALGDADYLASCGVRICLQGHTPVMAGYRAVYETMQALRDGTKPGDLSGVPNKEWMETFTREAEYKQWMKAYLEGDDAG